MDDLLQEKTPEEAPETAPVRADEQLDWGSLADYLRANLPEMRGAMDVVQFPGGAANLTYLVAFGEADLVVRRPPLGPVAPGAHDMAREYKVLSRLGKEFDRAPQALLLCEDDSIIGARFVVIERRTGQVIRLVYPEAMRTHRNLARRTSFALVDAMADLHAVDPYACGLEDLGRPDGFVARQVEGWNKRWTMAKDADVPLFDEIYRALADGLPDAQRVSVVHNDLKLDNCQFQADNPDRVTSIFDWDMATLGDPLIDLGTLLNYWAEPGDEHPRTVLPEGAADPFPSRAELVERYAQRSGLAVDRIGWYEAFALWKTAVVVQQIYIRFKRGQTQDERFAVYAERVPGLLGLAAAALGIDR
jgi:aminoglycoside phosphotransferase (APT) family kinase protein